MKVSVYQQKRLIQVVEKDNNGEVTRRCSRKVFSRHDANITARVLRDLVREGKMYDEMYEILGREYFGKFIDSVAEYKMKLLFCS